MDPPQFTIRLFQDSDEPGVVDLWNAVFAYTAPHNDPAVSIRRKRAVQPELFLVAEIAGRIVGSVMGGYDGHRGWIYSLAVSPAQRRRGIGAALMKRVESELARLDCPKINLQVLRANAAVVDFYRRLGYAVEDRLSLGKLTDGGAR
ncbi:MAG TPA: GNAT family acetyltransferase [Pirellulales bacterium]|nr:GNAT family acetyltransferase [Pirellulales bacterium]